MRKYIMGRVLLAITDDGVTGLARHPHYAALNQHRHDLG